MSGLLNVFLAMVLVISIWPSLVYVVRNVTVVVTPGRTSNLLHNVRFGLVGSKRPPHPADPPVCMAKLIMLRHRMQQASARRAQQRITPVSKPGTFGYARHRPTPSWVGQTTYKTPIIGRRWSNVGR